MRKFILNGFAVLLIMAFMVGLLPAVSLAAGNELVLTKIGHSSTDTVTISDAQTRSVTLSVPYQFSGNTINLSTGLIIDKAANISTVLTSFKNGSTAVIGAAPVTLTVTYYKGTDTLTPNSTEYAINVVRAARSIPTFNGAITKSFTGVMPNDTVRDISFTASDFTNLYSANDGGAMTKISILGSSLACGSLKIRGEASYADYISGDMINISNIGNLVFDAVNGGSVTYLVSAYSSAETAIGSALLSITVNKITVPTISGSLAKSVNIGSTVTFSLSDFSSLYNLNFGTLNKIEVTPAGTAAGTWYNGSAPITGSASFTASTINNLRFTGTADGSAAFSWTVSNEAGVSLPGSGTVTMKNVTVPTITAAVIKSVNYNTTLDFSITDFSGSYNLNNGSLVNIIITPANTGYGTWYKGSAAFTAATAFDASSIGSLKFKGTMVGVAAFTWTVSNERGASLIGNGSVTVNPTAASTTYSTAQNVEKTFSAADLNTACSNATGSTLNYIYFPTATPSASGTLYFGYSSASNPGIAVSSNTAYYTNKSPSISKVTFVPASNFSGTVTIPYAGLTVNNISFTGTIKITVSSTGIVTYTTPNNTPKTFSASDFVTVSSNTIGGNLSRIVITAPSAAAGTLYYNYVSASSPGIVIPAGTTFYPSNTPVISGITFVPSPNFTGSVSISYTGINTSEVTYTSSVIIKVTAPPADISYSARSGQALKLSSSDLNTVCLNTTGANLNYVTFALPAATYGKLYYNYSSSTVFGTAVSTGMLFYKDIAPFISNIAFVPAASYTGSVTIPYTGYNVNGVSFSGKIVVQVSKPFASIYFADVGQSYDWAAASIDYLYEIGIVKGSGGSLYNPGASITRGDFVLMLSRAFGFSGITGSNFADVPIESYYYNAISAAKALGIAQGSDNNFYPNSTLTRQDAMVLIFRTLVLTGAVVPPGSAGDIAAFTDKGLISSYALTAVEALVKAGLFQGSGARLNPAGNLSRAEMAVVIYRVKTTY